MSRLIPIAVLYGGRIGVAALGLVILPWLSNAMPADQFGLASTIIALQSLAIVLDLGLSVTIAREFPVLQGMHEHRDLMHRSEWALLLIYLGVTAIAVLLWVSGMVVIPLSTILLICFSLLLVVWQNLIIIAFVSRQWFKSSTLVQFTSLLLRHGCSLAFVIVFGGTLEIFVLGQLCGSTVVLLASRLAFVRRHPRVGVATAVAVRQPGTTSIAVMVYGIAGACAMQLDKVLLTAVASPSQTGPYFLASTLSLVPITFLASPVSQFVQPKLIAAVATERYWDARRWVVRLILAIVLCAVLPGIALGLASPWLIPLWLQGSAHQTVVGQYVTLLMPGASLGALGLIPSIILITRRDYRAMATISCALAVLVLGTTTLLARYNAITEICIAYSLYHIFAAIALWWRAARIESWFGNPFAIRMHLANGGNENRRDDMPLNPKSDW